MKLVGGYWYFVLCTYYETVELLPYNKKIVIIIISLYSVSRQGSSFTNGLSDF